jgi:hypothetical protein
MDVLLLIYSFVVVSSVGEIVKLAGYRRDQLAEVQSKMRPLRELPSI